ncbi:succinate dehydrogenase, cytochrome b556 subunit [Dethiosulfatarculus sandiegensis]|uniref:Succinate dehydrogenase cytochrome b556 subunit n=1 Tax=Dethiosulfatarculus sandiegensis TaxID=1429043 RepID=A0A0D2G8S6_9BACT|nr:succinate dehydrogenase, cytochrome b556 subunit [Dethiosulfatarculus sandiegensis]KIX11322.1 succinate dehydrogenase [Dethiosulfatarculus sandiegensis]
MKAYPPKVHYRLHPGYVAWILHRVTGLGLALYLFMHIWVIHNISRGKEAFNEVMAVVQSPIFHILEIGLLGCVVFHGLNGIRVVLLDYAGAADKGPHKTWVWATLAVSAAITVIGGIPMLQMAFH